MFSSGLCVFVLVVFSLNHAFAASIPPGQSDSLTTTPSPSHDDGIRDPQSGHPDGNILTEKHTGNTTVNGNDTHGAGHKDEHRMHVSTFNFDHVAEPYAIALWLLLASFSKMGFHMNNRLSSVLPESTLLIVLGLLVGVILFFSKLANTEDYVLKSDVFFLFLLPPIVLEAGYFLPKRAFFDNIGTILMYAIFGTLFNTVAIGLSLYAFTQYGVGWIGRRINILDCMIFSSLISAVDPVAVLSVFEDIHVNEMLHIIVFGESLLNDAVTVVLYHMFETYSTIGQENIKVIDIFAGIASFTIVGLGGTAIGIFFGILTSFVTKYTDHVRVIEPIFVFVLSYLSYLTAEMFHLSGIMAIVSCGLSMKKYVEYNISQKSHTTIKYFMKMLANISETVIFMFLGLSTVVDTHDWDTAFVLLTLLFCLVYRTIGIVILTFVANRFRLIQLGKVDQFVMSYGGLRGAIAFSLVSLLDAKLVPHKQLMVTCSIVVIFFTVFIQGTTIKPLVNFLHVKKSTKTKPTMNEQIHERLVDHAMAGIEDITGYHGHHLMRERFQHFDNKYLKRFLVRKEVAKGYGRSIISVWENLNKKDAMEFIQTHGSFANSTQELHVLSNTKSLARLIREHSYASLPSAYLALYHMMQEGGSHQTCVHEGEESEADSTSREGREGLHKRSSVPHITNDQSVLDMKSVEAAYTKKMADDIKIHHIIEDNMFKPRKAFEHHKKNTIGETSLVLPFHHQARLHLRHLLGKKKRDTYKNRKHSQKNGGHSNGKQKQKQKQKQKRLGRQDSNDDDRPNKSVSFATLCTPAPPEIIVEDTSMKVQTRLGHQDSDEESDQGITFTAKPELRVDVDVDDAPPSQNTPTAAESSLPWKRNTGRDPISSTVINTLPDDFKPESSEVPSWADNLVDLSHIPIALSLQSKGGATPQTAATENGTTDTGGKGDGDGVFADETDAGEKAPPLPWRTISEDANEPMRSPSASHDIAEAQSAPMSSSHSHKLSESDLQEIESNHKHLQIVHSQPIMEHMDELVPPPGVDNNEPSDHDIVNRVQMWLENAHPVMHVEDVQNPVQLEMENKTTHL